MHIRPLLPLVLFALTGSFANVQPPANVPPLDSVITGHVFYDINNNGLWELSVPGEVAIEGWKIALYKKVGMSLVGTVLTNSAGLYTFIRPLDFTEYVVRELPPVITTLPPKSGFVPSQARSGTRRFRPRAP
jgi:hypothetical protein